MTQETQEATELTTEDPAKKSTYPRAVKCSSCDNPALGWIKRIIEGKAKFTFYCREHRTRTTKK